MDYKAFKVYVLCMCMWYLHVFLSAKIKWWLLACTSQLSELQALKGNGVLTEEYVGEKAAIMETLKQ